jgi:anthranilate phosphoribosyltransferase
VRVSDPGAHPSWSLLLEALLGDGPVSDDGIRWAMGQVMSGAATPAQIAALLVAMRSHGVDTEQLAVLVDVMLEHSVPVAVPGPAVDTCGTGGDHSGSVNISTMAAVVVAASGRTVIKHGNRAASSQSGSADVLQELGVVVDLAPDLVPSCVADAGIAFCFAQVFHPAMRHAGPVRKELGMRSVFNFLGPLANPARPAAQVVGVPDPQMAAVVAGALARRGTVALVVRGDDGMDEITTTAPTHVWDARGPQVTETVIDTLDFGIERPEAGALDGGDAAHNASVARAVLAGADEPHLAAVRDAVAVNAAAAMVVYDTVTGAVAADAPLGEVLPLRVAKARDLMVTGASGQTLQRWIDVTRQLAAGASTES